jgi:hypothetical protein
VVSRCVYEEAYMKYRKSDLLQSAGCLLCAVAALRSSAGLEGTELEGGAITGPMLDASFIGTILFMLALVVTLRYPRPASGTALAASALCLPLYIFRALPRLFRLAFPGVYAARPQGTFVWHTWSATGILSTVLVVYLCSRSLLRRPDRP